jgi:hypothetical protein
MAFVERPYFFRFLFAAYICSRALYYLGELQKRSAHHRRTCLGWRDAQAPFIAVENDAGGGGDFSAGPVPFKPRHARLFEVSRMQDLPGSWRTPPIPLPRSQTPVGSS